MLDSICNSMFDLIKSDELNFGFLETPPIEKIEISAIKLIGCLISRQPRVIDPI